MKNKKTTPERFNPQSRPLVKPQSVKLSADGNWLLISFGSYSSILHRNYLAAILQSAPNRAKKKLKAA